MRLTIFNVRICIVFCICFAQHEDKLNEPGMMNVLEPTFAVANETVAINEFLQDNLNHPKYPYKAGMEGTVVIQFKVLPAGILSDFQVINSVCPEYDKAVKKAVEATVGMWSPGTNNGHPVTMEKEVTVVFKFEGIEMYKTAQLYAVNADQAFKEGKYSRAIKLYNKSIVLFPKKSSIFYQRGLAKYFVGDSKGAFRDLERSVYLGGRIADPIMARFLEDETTKKN